MALPVKNVGSTIRRVHAQQQKHAVIVSGGGRQPIQSNLGQNLNSQNVPTSNAVAIGNPLQRKIG